MDGEVIVWSGKCGREYSIRSFLSSIFDGPRSISSQPKREAGFLVFEDSNFTLLSGVKLGSGLQGVLMLAEGLNVGHSPRLS